MVPGGEVNLLLATRLDSLQMHLGKTRQVFFALVLIVFSNQIGQGQIEDTIRSILAEVSLDSMVLSVRQLSGDTTVIVGDSVVQIVTRRSGTLGNARAATYIWQRLKSFGLDACKDDYSSTGSNIYAMQGGSEFPNLQFIICAHYDSFASTGNSPGADDNASGTAAVLEAARILSKRQLRYSVVYALWDEEEDALVGSRSYARRAHTRGDSIQGVINIDMIGCDSSEMVEVHSRTVAQSQQLASDIESFSDHYSVGLHVRILKNGSLFSDHSAFWDQGYSAVLLTEADYNLYEHTSGDVVGLFTRPQFHAAAKLAIGAFAKLCLDRTSTAIAQDAETPKRAQLFQNTPNPFNLNTIIGFQVTDFDLVTLKVFDLLGREVAALVNERKGQARYEVKFDASNLSTGVYLYRMTVGNYTSTRKMMLMK
jgi:hypothetical protein